MQTYSFDGTLTAISSITHNGGQSYGINQKLRREKFVQPDGSIEEVPTISGNGMRGLLRDKGMLYFARSVGYGVSRDGAVLGLSLPAFHFLFSGGSLTSTGGKALDLENARKIRQLIPLVSVFGGALGNIILPGKLKVNKAIPICAETAHLLPARYTKDRNLQSCWELCQEEMYTRKDDAKNWHLRGMLDESTRRLLDAAEGVKRRKTESAEAVENTGGNQQMMYYIETFAAGTVFHWRVILEDPTDVEFEAALTCLTEFAKSPFAGGKSGAGMGEVRCDFDGWHRIDSRIAVDAGSQVQHAPGELYRNHLAENADSIRALLAQIV